MQMPVVTPAQRESGVRPGVSGQLLVQASCAGRAMCAKTEADLFVLPDLMLMIITLNVRPVKRDMPAKTALEPPAPKENGQAAPWKSAINAHQTRQLGISAVQTVVLVRISPVSRAIIGQAFQRVPLVPGTSIAPEMAKNMPAKTEKAQAVEPQLRPMIAKNKIISLFC